MQENYHGYADWTTANIRDARNCHVATLGEVDHLTGKETRETAEFMTRACNTHAALVETLEAMTTHAEAMASILNSRGLPAYYLEAAPKISAARDILKAASCPTINT
jgi:hypothetical protein